MDKEEKELIKIINNLQKSFEQTIDGVTTYTLYDGKEYTSTEISQSLKALLNIIEDKTKLINLLASQLTTPVNNKEWVIKYWTNIMQSIKE